MTEPEPDDGLIERQFRIARLISDGCTDKEIAAAESITEDTVAYHVRRIMLRWNILPSRNVRVQITRRFFGLPPVEKKAS